MPRTARSLLGSILLVASGVAAGAGTTVAGYLVAHRSTIVFTARETVSAGGIVIPAGTKLVHDSFMSEGFDTLRLYLNVDPSTLEQKFQRRVEPESFLVIPYWVEEEQVGLSSRSVCLPPYWAGLLAGASTGSEVTRLLGTGYLVEDRGARYFTDRSKSTTLKVEFGTDELVALAELREGLDPSIPAEMVDDMISEWVRPTDGMGVWGEIRLGDQEGAVRKNLGEPSKVFQDGPETVWTYDSICRCELGTGLSFSFRGGRLIAFSVWALMG